MLQIPPEKLKEFLVRDGLVTSESFDALAAEATRLGQGLDDTLISRGLVSDKYLLNLLSSYFGVGIVSLDTSAIDESVIPLLPEEIARKRRLVVFSRNPDGSFNVAMENPSDLESVEFLSNFLKAPIKTYLVTGNDLNRGFSIYSREFTRDFRKIIEENIKASLSRSLAKEAEQAATEVPIVGLVDNLISYAASLGASDIHIEALESGILVRFRVDGILHEVMNIPKEVHQALIARIKLLAALKLDEHNQPQDGRFRYKIAKDFIDIRVSVMPTFHGEKVVLRLLPATQKPMSLSELGLSAAAGNIVSEGISRTYGMAIVCGPTGSGKTTTLYAILNLLNKPEVNIVTIEDPIEYEMKYINQTQINPKAGITFANGLRSMLRQDPNIILVGEIRDEETAEISVHSALTGHLLLSSLHTNDAATAVPRLMDMKVVPFLISAVLNVIIAQRLVRKICMSCIYSYEPDTSAIKNLTRQLKEINGDTPFSIPKVLYRGKGCSECGNTGYRSRIGIFEVLNVDDGVRALITGSSFSLDNLRALARRQGMVGMFADGLNKAQLGITTIEEILRVIRE